MKITGLQNVDFSAGGQVLAIRTAATVEVDDALGALAVKHGMAREADAGADAVAAAVFTEAEYLEATEAGTLPPPGRAVDLQPETPAAELADDAGDGQVEAEAEPDAPKAPAKKKTSKKAPAKKK